MIFSASALFCANTRALSWSSLKVPSDFSSAESSTAGHHRVLRVALGEILLRLRRHQIFQELHRRRLVGRIARHGTAADVDVRAAVGLVGEHHADLGGDLAVLRLLGAHEVDVIVGVADAELGFAGGHALDLVGVAAARRARQVGRDALGPRLGLLRPVGRQQRAHQRLVVDVARSADQQLALPLGIGQVLVVLRRVGRRHLLLVVHDHARTLGEAEPGTVRVAQVRRHRLGQDLGRDRLQQAHLAGALDAAGIGGDQDIARALVALGLEPLDQGIGLGVDAVDLHTAQIGEVAVERFVSVVMARRIEVEGGALRLRSAKDENACTKGQTGLEGCATLHGTLHCE